MEDNRDKLKIALDIILHVEDPLKHYKIFVGGEKRAPDRDPYDPNSRNESLHAYAESIKFEVRQAVSEYLYEKLKNV